MHTEEEAKKKWCPMVRIEANTFQASYNKYPSVGTGLPTLSLCIASDCMMFRFVQTQRKGYCGLAGRE